MPIIADFLYNLQVTKPGLLRETLLEKLLFSAKAWQDLSLTKHGQAIARFAGIGSLKPESDTSVLNSSDEQHGSACGPVIVPVFKTGGWQAILSPMGSTPIRFRQAFSPSSNFLSAPHGLVISPLHRWPCVLRNALLTKM